MVDGCFAAHRRVHLRQQSGWHLHKGHTSHEAGRCKTRHVADHATAKGKQNSFAITSLAEQAVKNKVQREPIFVHLAIGQLNAVNAFVMSRQCLAQSSFVKW